MQLVSKISNLCDPDPPTSQTDRETDRWTDNMRSQYRALHFSASRGNYYAVLFLQTDGKTVEFWGKCEYTAIFSIKTETNRSTVAICTDSTENKLIHLMPIHQNCQILRAYEVRNNLHQNSRKNS